MLKHLTLAGLLAALAAGSLLAQVTDRPDPDGPRPMAGLAMFKVPLSPSSQNPPVEGVGIAGEAVILIHMRRDSGGELTEAVVDFILDIHTDAPRTFTAMHIHRGRRGMNGGVAVNAAFGGAMEADAGGHRIFRQRVLTEADDLATVREILRNPARFYLNLHSMSNRPGVVRGQLMRPDSAAIEGLGRQLRQAREANTALAGELADIKETLSRIARANGVVPVE